MGLLVKIFIVNFILCFGAVFIIIFLDYIYAFEFKIFRITLSVLMAWLLLVSVIFGSIIIIRW